MKSYLSLIPISQRVHKRQNRMTQLCIIFAVFLVTCIFSMADMELRSQKIRAISEYGNWHISLESIPQQYGELIGQRPDVAASAWYGILNYRLDEAYFIGNKKAAVCGADEALLTQIMGGLLEGAYPERDGEIVITENAKESLGVAIGDRVSIHMPTGQRKEYRISGFGKEDTKVSKMDAIGIFMPVDAFQEIYQEATQEELHYEDLVYYVQFQEKGNILQSINHIQSQYGLTDNQIGQNTALLGIMGLSSNSYMRGLYLVAMVLFLLVMTAGVFMIASSMNSNIVQQTAFFGMLRCIGADKKQVMRIVRLEALHWCKIAIPIGVGMGVLFTWLMCAALRFLSAKYFADMPLFDVSLVGIGMGVLVGLLTVWIAAHSPAKKAAKVSPLTAASGNGEQLKNIRHEASINYMPIDTALGIHHARQNKRNFVLMVGSFALSILLFLGFSPLIDFMNHAITPLRPYTPDVSIVSPEETCSVSRELVSEINGRDGVKRVYGRMFAYDIPALMDSRIQKVMLISYEAYQFNWVDEKNWASNSIGLEKVMKDREEGFVLAAYNDTNSLAEGDKIATALGELTVAGILEHVPFDSNGQTQILVCSEALFTKLTGETDYTIIDIQLTRNATDRDIDALRQIAGSNVYFSDHRPGNQAARGAYYSFALFIYGFLVVIAMIAMFNIVNSISMSVSARLKQYGAMRAVGMEMKQIKNMIRAETYTYALAGIFAGGLLGLLLHRFLWNLLIFNRWNDLWEIPFAPLALIITLMIISCELAVYRPVKRIANMPVVTVIASV